MAQVLRAAGGSFNEELRELQLLSGVLLWLLCGRWSTAPPSDALGAAQRHFEHSVRAIKSRTFVKASL